MNCAPRWCGAALFLFLLPAGKEAVAQELEGYIQEIRARNPAYQAAYQRWRVAKESIKIASSLPDPKVNLGFFVEEVETRVGPQKQRLGLSQAIPWKGKLALKGQRAEEMAHKAKMALGAVTLKLETDFKLLYAELFYTGRSISITLDHLELLKNLEAVITERYETNAAQYNDLIRIQIEIDALSDRLKTKEESSRPVASSMNAILGRPVERMLPYPSRLPVYAIPEKIDPEQLAVRLPRQNPMLKGLDHQIAADRVSLDLAKKNIFPDFRVGLDWINTGSAINPGLPASGKDPLILSVGLNLPIWKRKYKAIDRAAASRVEASMKQRNDAQAHLHASLKRALFQLDDANRKIQLYRDLIIPKAEESLTVITSGFQTGESSYLDLIEAEKALLEFLLSLTRAQTNQLKAITAIEAVLGEAPFEKGEG